MYTTDRYANPERLRQYGDDLERHFAEQILNRIPAYATFWATYIGNDGEQHSLPMPGASGEAHANRDSIWQNLYTLFESLALCWSLESEFLRSEGITSLDDYLRNLNAWTAFYAHLGRIHDMAEKATILIGEDRLFADFDPFYEQRHIALHGIKVPMRWADNVLFVPPLGETAREWHTRLSWNDLTRADFASISTTVGSTLRGLERVVARFLQALLQLAHGKLGLRPVTWPDRPAPRLVYGAGETPMAGTRKTLAAFPKNTSGYSGVSVHGTGLNIN